MKSWLLASGLGIGSAFVLGLIAIKGVPTRTGSYEPHATPVATSSPSLIVEVVPIDSGPSIPAPDVVVSVQRAHPGQGPRSVAQRRPALKHAEAPVIGQRAPVPPPSLKIPDPAPVEIAPKPIEQPRLLPIIVRREPAPPKKRDSREDRLAEDRKWRREVLERWEREEQERKRKERDGDDG